VTEETAAGTEAVTGTVTPTVAVVGGGGIGTFFAGYLLAAGRADVTLCVRTPFDELVVESERWEETLRYGPRVLVDPAALSGALETPVDWVLLATKAHQTDGAAGWLRALTGAGATVVVLQNGVEQVERVRPHVEPGTRVVPGIVYSGVEPLAPGRVVHRTNGFVLVPERDPGQGFTPEDAARLDALFASDRGFVRTVADVTTALWQKLCANVVANGITALTGRRIEVLGRDDIRRVALVLAEECLAVGRAEGASLDTGFAAATIDRMVAMPAGAGSSMLFDRLAGRTLEHDALYGAVTRAGCRHGIATPTTDAVGALLAAVSEVLGGQPAATGRETPTGLLQRLRPPGSPSSC
jgi:2-dehydropantoate 2-reductase